MSSAPMTSGRRAAQIYVLIASDVSWLRADVMPCLNCYLYLKLHLQIHLNFLL